MDYFFTEEQIMIRDLTRKITEEKIKPQRQQLDERNRFPEEIMQELAAVDLFQVFIPEKAGGLGGGITEICIVTEELSKGCAGVATT